MRSNGGLLAPAGAAVVFLVCLLAFQAALARPLPIGMVTGDPDDGMHRQFVDPAPGINSTDGESCRLNGEVYSTGSTANTSPPAPTGPMIQPASRPEARTRAQFCTAWAVLFMKGYVRQALWLVLNR